MSDQTGKKLDLLLEMVTGLKQQLVTLMARIDAQLDASIAEEHQTAAQDDRLDRLERAEKNPDTD